MCVTNIAKRRPEPVAMPQQFAVATPSILSQRLLGNLLPVVQNGAGGVDAANFPCAIPQQARDIAAAAATARLSAKNEAEQTQKTRPKRRRKPQKPGKTAKQNDRHFVVHNYHDHALDPDENDDYEDDISKRRGGVAVSFPLKLHAILDQVAADGLGHVISWQSHGRCFVIHNPKEFVDHVMPNYFRQTKLTSFQRQLNLYGFARLTRGQDSGGYYHELFLRGKPNLCKRMTRTKIKGTKFKAASSPDQEPDFYSMPPVVVSKQPQQQQHHSDSPSVNPPFPPPSSVQANISRALPGSSLINEGQGSPTRNGVQGSNPYLGGVLPNDELEPINVLPTRPSASTNRWVTKNSVTNPHFADSVLDEAVDELFSENPMGEDGNLMDLFFLSDSAAFGVEGFVDDTQLGFLLDRLLDCE